MESRSATLDAEVPSGGSEFDSSLASAGLSDAAFLTDLGLAVRRAREQRGMSRRAFAPVADISERYLSQLESGGGNISITLLRRVASGLGMGLSELFDIAERTPERRLIRRFLDSLPPARLEDVLRRLIEEFGKEETVRRKRIALIGLRGAGKSTLGTALARGLHRPFIELDREIEREAGISLSEVFLLYGQAGYRRIERRCLERLISSQQDFVLTVGGGIVSEPDTYNVLLTNCFAVWIKATPEEHMSRVIAQGDMRPMAGHTEAMEDLRGILDARASLYSKADAVLDTSGQTVSQSINALSRLLSPGASLAQSEL